jgi:hypothetical protein
VVLAVFHLKEILVKKFTARKKPNETLWEKVRANLFYIILFAAVIVIAVGENPYIQLIVGVLIIVLVGRKLPSSWQARKQRKRKEQGSHSTSTPNSDQPRSSSGSSSVVYRQSGRSPRHSHGWEDVTSSNGDDSKGGDGE